MNYVLMALTLLALVFGAALGSMQAVSAAVLESGAAAVRLCLELCGTVALWSGVMKIAERSGLCGTISRLLTPVTRLLFPGLRERSPRAVDAISMNITANLLGLGSAATPMALDAMAEMDRLNGRSPYASDEMVTFVVLNTASIQLLPTTVATIRRLEGSEAPMEILGCVLLATAASVTVGLTLALLLRGAGKRRPGHGLQ